MLTSLRTGILPAVGVAAVMAWPHSAAAQSTPVTSAMSRSGSGTSWMPAATPLPGWHTMAGGWTLMGHGQAFGQYDWQGGDRGGSQGGALNWAMLMASHPLFGGVIEPRAMLSIDAFTVTPRGYPLLLQSGESYQGEPLHDRQHPHDLFMELGASYEHSLKPGLAWQLYVAPAGEPALGPVAFMHRPSALDNPAAPIGHHWQDATHVTFGVVTAGLFTNIWKFEASVFNGREPDENRWNFDAIHFGSYSARLTVNPAPRWSVSASYGYLDSPEAHDPDVSVHRLTVSAMYNRPWRTDGQWATTLIYGANRWSSASGFAGSTLLESEAILDRQNSVFGRVEWVRKNAEELSLDTAPFNMPASRQFDVGEVTLGYVRELAQFAGTTLGLGASGTLNVVPAALESAYGSTLPLGAFIFLRLRPALRRDSMAGMDHMHMDDMRMQLLMSSTASERPAPNGANR